MLKGVIFDCDGVLFESRMANLAYYNTVLEHFGEPVVDVNHQEKAHLCHTAATPRVLEVLLGPDRASEGIAFAAGLDYRAFIPHMTPEPGIMECLKALSTRFRLAVATNRGGSMDSILKHFEFNNNFDVVVTTRDVKRPKPFPDMLHLAMRHLDLPAKDLVFVGDSELDKQAAAAGVHFIAYKGLVEGDTTVNSHGELLEYVLSRS